jgi:hypothetical protein
MELAGFNAKAQGHAKAQRECHNREISEIRGREADVSHGGRREHGEDNFPADSETTSDGESEGFPGAAFKEYVVRRPLPLRVFS